MAGLFGFFARGAAPNKNNHRVPPARTSQVTSMQALSLTAVYRAIQIIATPISKMKIETFRYATGIENKIDNPVFVNKPSLSQTRREFLFDTVTSLAMHGEAFWFKTFNSFGQINNVAIIPASSVQVEYNKDMNAKLFQYNGNTYSTNEIEHLKLFSIAGELRGYGPIQTCRPDIVSALDLRNYASNWFGSAGVPTGVLSANQMLNQEQAENTREAFLKAQEERTVAVLGGGWNYTSIQLSPKDALFTEVQSQATQAVARLFGVPARLLLTGVDGTSDTYSNLQDENQVFYRHTLMAYTDAIADAMSNCLPRGNRVDFNFESLFKADQAARFNMWKVAIDAGFMTPEMVQEKEGLA